VRTSNPNTSGCYTTESLECSWLLYPIYLQGFKSLQPCFHAIRVRCLDIEVSLNYGFSCPLACLTGFCCWYLYYATLCKPFLQLDFVNKLQSIWTMGKIFLYHRVAYFFRYSRQPPHRIESKS
jgi:hypothetical protein